MPSDARRAMMKLFAADLTTAAFALALGQSGTATPANAAVIGPGKFRGAVLVFVGDGADNTQFGYKVWRRVGIQSRVDDSGTITVWERMLVCSGTVTLSQAVGASSTIFGAAKFMADTIVNTIDPGFQKLIDTLGGGRTVVDVYTPTADTDAARLIITDAFDGELEVELAKNGGAVTGMNAAGLLTR